MLQQKIRSHGKKTRFSTTVSHVAAMVRLKRASEEASLFKDARIAVKRASVLPAPDTKTPSSPRPGDDESTIVVVRNLRQETVSQFDLGGDGQSSTPSNDQEKEKNDLKGEKEGGEVRKVEEAKPAESQAVSPTAAGSLDSPSKRKLSRSRTFAVSKANNVLSDEAGLKSTSRRLSEHLVVEGRRNMKKGEEIIAVSPELLEEVRRAQKAQKKEERKLDFRRVFYQRAMRDHSLLEEAFTRSNRLRLHRNAQRLAVMLAILLLLFGGLVSRYTTRKKGFMSLRLLLLDFVVLLPVTSTLNGSLFPTSSVIVFSPYVLYRVVVLFFLFNLHLFSLLSSPHVPSRSRFFSLDFVSTP